MRPIVLAMVAMAAIVLAACAPQGSTGGSAGGGETKIVVELSEMKFAPPTIEVPAGKQVTLELRNRGSLDHDLVVDAINLRSRVVKPGQSQSLTIGPFPAGTTHDFYCSVTGHKAAGMVGRLIVK